MMTSKHTPGKWVQSGNRIVSDNDDSTTAVVQFEDSREGFAGIVEAQANAARIVECVNACEGIKNPAALKELLLIVEQTKNHLAQGYGVPKWLVLAKALAALEGK